AVAGDERGRVFCCARHDDEKFLFSKHYTLVLHLEDGRDFNQSSQGENRMSQKTKPTRRLRELMQMPGIIRSLGAHDVLTAVLIEQAGFETVFIGGFATRPASTACRT